MTFPADVPVIASLKGGKGDTGVLASLEVELLPWDAEPFAEMTGPDEYRGAVVHLPMPLPGPETVNNDDATELLLKNPTKTQGATLDLIEQNREPRRAADVEPVLVETRDTGLVVRTPANLRTGLPGTTMPGGGFASELTILVTGIAGSRVLTSSEPAKVAALGTNPFAAVLNSGDGSDDFFVEVLSQDGTSITLRRPLSAAFAGTLSSKYDAAVGQHLTRAATRAYARHALRASGTVNARGAILDGTWDALPAVHNQAWARNAALVAYGTSNSAAPVVRTDLTVQGAHNMLHAVDFIDMYPSALASGVLIGTHQSGHGGTAVLYTGRASTVIEFYTAAFRSTAVSSFGFEVRVVILGDGITLYDKVHDGHMNRVTLPISGVDKVEIQVTNMNIAATPFYIALSNLTLRDAGRSGQVANGKVVTLGDSWFAYYAAEFAKNVAALSGVEVVPRALGGMTTVWGLDWFDKYVLKEKPAECWIHFFTNDLNNNQNSTYVAPDGSTKPLWPNGLTTVQATELWVRNVRELILRCQRAGIRPVVFLPGGTASESQTQRHGTGAAMFDRPPLRDWVALAAELTDVASYVNTIGKRPGSRVLVGTAQKIASGGAPADAWA